MELVVFAWPALVGCFHTAPIRVGYEKTVYTTPEGDVEVELCVIIYQPPSGGAPRPFTISYSTEDDTACMSVHDFTTSSARYSLYVLTSCVLDYDSVDHSASK